MDSIERKIAYRVSELGGRVFYVGGLVRDRLLGLENKDVDIEVHGISPEQLMDVLKELGTPLAFGSSFGVYSLAGYDIDIAMPRKERATGRGHRDFEVFVDPNIGTTEAARRRDFTMNAMMEDVLTGEIIDPFNGRNDLDKGLIRHVDTERFSEDPLRVLRAARFASVFGFEVDEETVELCRGIDLTTLSRERVEGELKKALLKGRKPSEFFRILRKMNQLRDWFPELEKLIGLEQDPEYHPEGDVWTHTMEVIDRAAAFREAAENPYAFMMLALTHDLGKIVTTEEINGRIHAYGHETEGLPIAEALLQRLTGEKAVIRYVMNMMPLHMRPNVIAYSKSAVKKSNALFDAARAPKDLIYFSMADKPVMAGDDPFTGDSDFLFERYDLYREMMAAPYVTGDDLIRAGLEPGGDFSGILAYAHKLRLAGIDKEPALKQTIAYAAKLRKKS